MKKKRYAGVGSRTTPFEYLEVLRFAGSTLARSGFVLRSGAASGADSAFEKATLAAKGQCEIFLPWKGFNGHRSIHYHLPEKAIAIAEACHPSWSSCSESARKLHARNSLIVLGEELKEPVAFEICYTPLGHGQGGTGQAIRVAQRYGVPILDIGRFSPSKAMQGLVTFLKEFDVQL